MDNKEIAEVLGRANAVLSFGIRDATIVRSLGFRASRKSLYTNTNIWLVGFNTESAAEKVAAGLNTLKPFLEELAFSIEAEARAESEKLTLSTLELKR